MKYIDNHVHTNYSVLDGLATIKEYVAFGKQRELSALFISDHMVMSGAIEFYNECKKNEIKPIVGFEAYLSESSLKGDELKIKIKELKDNMKLIQESEDKTNLKSLTEELKHHENRRHLCLYAKNNKGYKNLCKLITYANLENFYYKPRIDYEVLKKYSSDLICTSACIMSDINQAILNNDIEKAENLILFYKDIFNDDFYIEIHSHDLEEETIINKILIELSKKHNIKNIIANDVHYLNKEDSVTHDVLLCKNTNAKLTDEKRFKFSNNEFYYKSYEEICESHKEYGQDFIDNCIDNTYEIIDKCNLELEIGKPIMPKFADNEKEIFKNEILKGIKRIYKTNISTEVFSRINYEISVISNMNFEGYFLIVQDYLNWARQQGIPVGPGRGSSGASIVCYLLGITEIDPIKYNLPFERFLNPDRIGIPDIDSDICIERRGEIIEYLKEKYGKYSVAGIITFGELKAKAAVKSVASTYGLDFKKANEITKAMSGKPDSTIDSELEDSPAFKMLYDNDEEIANIIDMAKKIEGRIQNSGCHASGYMISDRDISDICPLVRTKEGTIATAYSMDNAEKVGLVKYDILGLKNLTIIKNTTDLIKARQETEVSFDNIEYDDKKTYNMLSQGFSSGVFQLESNGMQGLLKSLNPSELKHLDAVIALYRPGPIQCGAIEDYINNKHNSENIKYRYPQIEDVLSDTYGTMIYQEQVMRLAVVLAGYTMSQADELRKGIGKKKKEIIDEHRKIFVDGCINNNIDESFAIGLYNNIEGFGQYAFNKSHSLAYAILAYRTAYLKANHSVEYMRCLLNHEIGSSDKIKQYISESFRIGLKALPPDINVSTNLFEINNDNNIVFGLAAIKGIGESALNKLLEERKNNGEYKSFWDLIERCSSVNKTALEGLIKTGSLKSIEANSKMLLSYVEFIQKAKTLSRYKEDKITLKDAVLETIAISKAKSLEEYKEIEARVKEIKSTKKEDKEKKANLKLELERMIKEELNSLTLNNDYGEDFTSEEYKDFEEELLGFSVSNNPMILFSTYEKYFDTVPIADLKNDDIAEQYKNNEQYINVIGLIRSKDVTEKGAARVEIEFLGESITVKFAPWMWEKINGRKVNKNKLCIIKLKVLDAYNKNFGNYDYAGENISILSFINDPEIIYFDIDDNTDVKKLSNILTNCSNECYNNNKEIKYITALKRKKDGKTKIMQSTCWVDDKKYVNKEMYYAGIEKTCITT